jgi:AraC-like DNA-binding protein
VIHSCRPAAALHRLVRYYYQIEDCLADQAVLQPVPARSPQIIEFMFGTHYQIRRLDRGSAEDVRAIALVGAQTFRRVDLVMRCRIDAFTIAFQPGGLSGLFSVPAEELTNSDFDGQAVLGHGLGVLQRRLGDVSRFSDRVRIADEFLCARRPASDAVSDLARTASQIIQSSGCVRVDRLAHSAGLSIRQFERRFRHEIGVAPKLYSRIVRFEAALRSKAAAPAMRWADIAHALGYHDQMHMVHDFNRLAGDSPTTIGSQLDMFVKPEVVFADQPG